MQLDAAQASAIGYIAVSPVGKRYVATARLEPGGKQIFVEQVVTAAVARSIRQHLSQGLVRPFPSFPELTARYGVIRVSENLA